MSNTARHLYMCCSKNKLYGDLVLVDRLMEELIDCNVGKRGKLWGSWRNVWRGSTAFHRSSRMKLPSVLLRIFWLHGKRACLTMLCLLRLLTEKAFGRWRGMKNPKN
ncbi:acetyl-CoA C-acetyltransferase [Trypanosoma rangeli]|uniref:Acetyl-CoA C-acetyltransferase n=1 Tax=Trypanosoma rangeli TaxID=5698 RepID=A0A422NNT7_TRYRA|nr:acetyl-CoA C-acetyltransferase [Trypanosoma rangeli]RNF07039.1 acetyl-CoA C-acetyltransferase [Trypanosoma rangeli]|eukprot:RNF07039.1 acetyl-CoA C-acetyltransferase [Trypanosoma rangeli]